MMSALIFSHAESSTRDISIASHLASALVPSSRSFTRLSTRDKGISFRSMASEDSIFFTMCRDRSTFFLPTLDEVLLEFERVGFEGRLLVLPTVADTYTTWKSRWADSRLVRLLAESRCKLDTELHTRATPNARFTMPV